MVAAQPPPTDDTVRETMLKWEASKFSVEALTTKLNKQAKRMSLWDIKVTSLWKNTSNLAKEVRAISKRLAEIERLYNEMHKAREREFEERYTPNHLPSDEHMGTTEITETKDGNESN